MPAQHDAARRLLIRRGDLPDTHLAPDPDAPDSRALEAGQARLAIEQFALTANNITYAAFGEAMKYWQFFPSPEPAFGCLPVWGFATVLESRAEGLDPGRRLWGYYPAGRHLVVRADRIGKSGFIDAAPHRAELAAVYNQYAFCDADPSWRPELEGLQAVLRPLFFTSFLIDDFLDDNGFFGASRVLLSSASSKTAFGTAFCLALRRGRPGAPRIVGLSSPANAGFARGLGCYDEIVDYADVASLDAREPTVYVDFAGDTALRRRVHEHLGGALMHSAVIGGTHWRAAGGFGSGASNLPGPKPTFFFAPAQIAKRSRPEPDGWGPGGFARRAGAAWQAFVERVQASDAGETWVRIVTHRGMAEVERCYRRLLDGKADPREGSMLVPVG